MSRSQVHAQVRMAAWIAVTAGGLSLFWIASVRARLPHTGFGGSTRLVPPVFAAWAPVWAWSGLLAVGIVVGLTSAGLRLSSTVRVKPAVIVSALVVALFALSAATAVVRGDTDSFVRTIKPSNAAQYSGDVDLVSERSVRAFVRSYPILIREPGRSIHTVTHPPGALLLVALLERASPGWLVPRALVLMVLSALVLIPMWFLARRVAGQRTALVSVLLLATVPSVVIHGATSLDAALTTLMVGAAALLVRASDEQAGPVAALLAGAAVGVCSFFTYAAAFLAAFGVVYALWTRPRRDAVRTLGLCAAGGVLALGVMWITLGYDPIAASLGTTDVLDARLVAEGSTRPWAYWLAGAPVAWLIMAGAPVAGLSLKHIIEARPRVVLAFMIPIAVVFALPPNLIGLLPGELERTLLFAYPFATLAAAAAIVSLPEHAQGRWTAACVLLGGIQTVVMEALFFFAW